MRISALAVIAALAIASPALAQEESGQTTPSEPEYTSETVSQESPNVGGREDPDEEVICRWVQSSAESRLRRSRTRICGTRTQWEIMEDENRRQIVNRGSVQGRSD